MANVKNSSEKENDRNRTMVVYPDGGVVPYQYIYREYTPRSVVSAMNAMEKKMLILSGTEEKVKIAFTASLTSFRNE